MLNPSKAPSILKRWVLFCSVGAIGIIVQMSVLMLLVSGFKVHYLPATALAVEAAVLNNFFWHENWTWADRTKGSHGAFCRRLLYFHLTNGALSLAGNIALMKLLVEFFKCGYIQANALAIASCSIFNFLAGDLVVYRSEKYRNQQEGNMAKISFIVLFISAAMLLNGASAANAAELHPETLKAWSDYVKATEKRISAELSSKEKFLSLDFQAASKAVRDRQALLSGDILIEKVSADDRKDIPDGLIHHWRGVVFIPGVSLDSVLFRVQNPTTENVKQEDVMDSHILEKEPGQLRLYLKLQRSKIITVVYNTEHFIQYLKCSNSKAWSSSIATKIREIEKGEREKPEGRDSGFLWKLNSYWRYEQVDGGVIVECESMTLSRSVPPVLSLIVNPIINRVARESMQRTLQSFRARLTKAGQQSASICLDQ